MTEVVVGILLQFGEPDHFLGVDALAVDDSGDLPVGAAGVEADAAAVHMAAHGLSHLVGGRALLQRQIQNLQIPLVELIDEGKIKVALTLGGVGLLQPLRQLAAAADGHPEAAGGPQQELDITLHIAVVGLCHFGGAVNHGVVDGNPTLVPLQCDGQRLGSALQIRLAPDTKGNKGGIQLGCVLHFIVYA